MAAMRPVCQVHVGLLDHLVTHFSQLSIARRYVHRVQRRPMKRFASTGAYDNQTPATLDAILDDAEAMGQHARAVPVSPSYFSRQATFQDLYLRLVALSHKYASMPTVPADQRQRVAWRNRFDYRLTIGDTVKASDFKKCLAMVKKLHAIHPSLRTEEIDLAIEAFKRTVQPGDNLARPRAVDEHGRAVGVGRRKSSTARAWLVEGTGEVQINGKSIADAFGRIHDRESATWALRATERLDKYNVWAIISGGGTTGQAEAMTLAVAKALMVHEPDLKPALRRAGCITRDARKVERKKHGHIKARKSPTWVKR